MGHHSGRGRTLSPHKPVALCICVLALTAQASAHIGITGVTAGYEHTCAFRVEHEDADGAVHRAALKCWGSNAWGQLGLGKVETSGDDDSILTAVGDSPKEMGQSLPMVAVGCDVAAVAAGLVHTCAVCDHGDGKARTLKCWGKRSARLGLGLGIVSDDPGVGDRNGEMGKSLETVDLGSSSPPPSRVAAGSYHTCVALEDGSVRCFGANDVGQLGLGDTLWRGDDPTSMGDSLPAVDLGARGAVAALAAGAQHTCALFADGAVVCWGGNSHGQLGIGSTQDVGLAPGQMGAALATVDLGAGRTATAIAAGYDHTCAILDDGSLKCWGASAAGQLGLGDLVGDVGDEPSDMGDALPAVLPGDVTGVTAGASHTCAVLTSGDVKCWGSNFHGETGNADMGHSSPIGVDLGSWAPGGVAVAVSAGSYHTCAILRTDEESLKCWGLNSAGQLGLGHTTNKGEAAGQMGDALPAVDLTWESVGKSSLSNKTAMVFIVVAAVIGGLTLAGFAHFVLAPRIQSTARWNVRFMSMSSISRKFNTPTRTQSAPAQRLSSPGKRALRKFTSFKTYRSGKSTRRPTEDDPHRASDSMRMGGSISEEVSPLGAEKPGHSKPRGPLEQQRTI